MTKLLEIITNPNKILRKKSIAVECDKLVSDSMVELIKNMTKTMLENDGIGIAAPQIGKNIRLVVINIKDEILILFNPKIIKKSIFKEWGIEGCLSVPDTFGDVKRAKNIIYCYTDQKGVIQKKRAKGMLARVVQHELDHLDGILFIDKARDIEEVLEKK